MTECEMSTSLQYLQMRFDNVGIRIAVAICFIIQMVNLSQLLYTCIPVNVHASTVIRADLHVHVRVHMPIT